MPSDSPSGLGQPSWNKRREELVHPGFANPCPSLWRQKGIPWSTILGVLASWVGSLPSLIPSILPWASPLNSQPESSWPVDTCTWGLVHISDLTRSRSDWLPPARRLVSPTSVNGNSTLRLSRPRNRGVILDPFLVPSLNINTRNLLSSLPPAPWPPSRPKRLPSLIWMMTVTICSLSGACGGSLQSGPSPWSLRSCVFVT